MLFSLHVETLAASCRWVGYVHHGLVKGIMACLVWRGAGGLRAQHASCGVAVAAAACRNDGT